MMVIDGELVLNKRYEAYDVKKENVWTLSYMLLIE